MYSKMQICDKIDCTACGACVNVCPRQCIELCADELDALHPFVNSDKCIECYQCVKVCPANSAVKYHTPKRAYAAWSRNENTRKSSASGGVATEIYNYVVKNGWYSVGVKFDIGKGAYFVPVQSVQDIAEVRNSKYTYSYSGYIYKQVKRQLNDNRRVVFIALPCQIAALYNYLKQPYDNLITVDIICHGVAPTAYIEQHIGYIEKRKRRQADNLSFRDANYKTNKFVLSLKDSRGYFYTAKAQSRDAYQLGYHRALNYRENCYRCRYACPQRVADITIGDFSGLGRVEPLDFERVNVSCVLVNTDKGADFIKLLGNRIVYSERPLAEALNYEKQLQYPSVPHRNRKEFVDRYRELRNYDMAAEPLLKDDIKQIYRERFSLVRLLKKLLVLATTKQFRRRLKTLIKGENNVK